MISAVKLEKLLSYVAEKSPSQLPYLEKSICNTIANWLPCTCCPFVEECDNNPELKRKTCEETLTYLLTKES